MKRARTPKAKQAKRLLSALSRVGIAFDRAEPPSVKAAGIAYFAGPEVLLIQRGNDTAAYPGHWAFPAGHVEPGETPMDAAWRESVEEIAHFPEDLVPVSTEAGFALFVCECEAFDPVLNDESLAFKWCRPDALPAPLHPGIVEQIARANPRGYAMDADFEESKHPRTESGKFGSGEAHAAIKGDELGEHPDTKALRKAAMTYAENHLIGRSFKNGNSGHEIKVTRQGIKHSLSNTNEAEVRLMPALSQMLEKAVHVGSEPDRLGRPDIKAAHKYLVPVKMGDREMMVGIVTRERQDGIEHYDHFLLPEMKKPPSGAVPGAIAVSGEWADQPSKGTEDSLHLSGGPVVTAEDKKDTDINGYATYDDTPISKVGVFEYRGSQIPDAPDPNAIYKVLRSEEELSDPQTIESFKLQPWIDEHTMLGGEDEGLTPPEKKGIGGVIGEKVHYKDGYLRGNLRVFSEAMKRLLAAGKRELSCGYRCRYEATPGTYDGQAYDYIQREIRGNHLASVKEGRMGPEVAVQDQADRFVFTCDSSSFKSTEVKNMDTTSSAAPGAGATGEVTLESVVAQLNALVKAVAQLKQAQGGTDPAADPAADPAKPAPGADDDADPNADPMAGDGDPMTKLTKTVDALCSRMDAMEGKTTDAADPGKGDAGAAPQKDDPDGTNKGDGSVIENPKGGPAMDEKTVAAKVEASVRAAQTAIVAKTALADKVSPYVGTFDHSLMMTEGEVAGYACKKLELKPAKGQELATLNGYLHGRTPPSKERTTSTMDAAGGAGWLDKQLSA